MESLSDRKESESFSDGKERERIFENGLLVTGRKDNGSFSERECIF